MKSFFVSLLLLTSTFSQAKSIDHTKVLATVSGYEQGITQVALLEDGRLQVVGKNGSVQTVQLSKAVLNRLSGQIMSLANVEVVEETRTIVCKMMILPTLSDLTIAHFDYEANEYTRNLSLIMTRQSCAIEHEVYPKNDFDFAEARELRAQLVILALNTLAK